jgi:phenylpyruvate tautomerase PptA (4-oxalocrotonate tautomerase family)
MPFIRTSVHKDTTPAQRQAIVNGIHQALIDGIGMPADELFNMVEEYDEQKFFFSRTFNGYKRSDRVVVVEITMRRGRSDAMKRASTPISPPIWKKMRAWHPAMCSSSRTKTTTPTGRWAAASSPWPLPSRSAPTPDSCVNRLQPRCRQGCNRKQHF